MHELAVCQSLLVSVEQTAKSNHAQSVSNVYLSIGPLSGIEAPLLKRAWTIARVGTLAADAALVISAMPILIECSTCGHEGPAKANKLICENCHDWRVKLVSGDEMMLTSLDLDDNSYLEGTL